MTLITINLLILISLIKLSIIIVILNVNIVARQLKSTVFLLLLNRVRCDCYCYVRMLNGLCCATEVHGCALSYLGLYLFVWPQIYWSVALVVDVWLYLHTICSHYCYIFSISVISTGFEIQKSLSGVRFRFSISRDSFGGCCQEFDLPIAKSSFILATTIVLLKYADI